MSDSQSSQQKLQMQDERSPADEARASAAWLERTQPLHPIGEQPTIISNRPPLQAPVISDSAWRIMEGRILPGDRLGHFELVEYVGGGGMGRVFRATDPRLARSVAIKILPPEQAADPETLQRFQNEAQSAARLDHENIARVHYVGEDRGIHFIVFEFVEGENVRKLVDRKGPLPLDEAVSYMLQASGALAHADARHVVHRDIKPSNLLITPAGRVKLIDMGLARLRVLDPETADITASGVTLGTFDYISPEQARDPRSADIRSDIYSLGCTFFFMLTGRPPYPQGTMLQKLLQHHGDPPPDVRQYRGDLPDGANRILQKMMAKDRKDRYADAWELTAELLSLADQIGLETADPAGQPGLVKSGPKPSSLQRHLPGLASIAALVCIIAALHFVWNQSGPSRPVSSQLPATRIQSGAEPLQSVIVLPEARANAAGREKSATASEATREDGAIAPSAGSQQERATAGGRAPQDLLNFYSAANLARKTGPKASGNPNDHSADPGKRNSLLIVSNVAGGENQFTSLAAACAAARSGDVIELRYNGSREEKPIRATNLRATIRAGDGFQPAIIFRPNDADQVKNLRSMLVLSSGRLTVSGLSIEFIVPRNVPADNWTLMELHGGQSVRLEKCLLTIANASERLTAYNPDVSFFCISASSGAEAVRAAGTPAATPLATVELADAIARGEAVFMRVDDLQPAQLAWDNGLLAISERLLFAGGGRHSPRPDEMLRIDLRHVTVAARGGLVHLAGTQAAPYQFTVQLNCTDNIIITSPSNPLIEQDAMGSLENARRQVVWNGDHNFYQDVGIFWTIRSRASEPSSEIQAFDAWRAYWGPSRENQPFAGRIEWNNAPGAERPFHTHNAADYALDERVDENPAIGGAHDGRDAGMLPERLIALP
jgi:serine/threonine protein kinase